MIHPDSFSPSCKNQFWQDHFRFIAAKKVVIILVAILAPPVQDGRDRDLVVREGGAVGRGECAGQAGKGLALGVVDPPAVAVADQVNRVAGAGGGDGGKRRAAR